MSNTPQLVLMYFIMFSSENICGHPTARTGISWEWGSVRPKNVKNMNEAQLEFLEG